VDVQVLVKFQEFGKYFSILLRKVQLLRPKVCTFRRVRTLYACMAENDGELSFEPNQIITNGKL